MKIGILLSLSIFSQDSESVFKAAAESTVIMPAENVLMGGFSPNRMSTGVHDDLFARCIVFEKNNQKMAWVSLDLLGFLRYDVFLVKKELAERRTLDPSSVFIFSTHQHSGPDTLGLWGRIPIATPGRNEKYLAEVRQKIVKLIAETAAKTEPANLKIIKTVSKEFSKNRREPDLLDKDITILLVSNEKKHIATIVNFGCHPEVMFRSNTLISADFPGVLAKHLEAAMGGTTIFINGILGGMVTPNTAVLKTNYSGFDKCEAMGKLLSRWVIDAVIQNQKEKIKPDWTIKTEHIKIPLENHAFKLAVKHGAIPKSEEVFQDWHLITEVSVINLGGVSILLVPGEILPKLGLEIKAMFPGKYTMMFTLANDEIGYIIHPDDWSRDLYRYERSMSVGPKAGKIILETFKKIAVDK